MVYSIVILPLKYLVNQIRQAFGMKMQVQNGRAQFSKNVSATVLPIPLYMELSKEIQGPPTLNTKFIQKCVEQFLLFCSVWCCRFHLSGLPNRFSALLTPIRKASISTSQCRIRPSFG